MKKHIYTYDEKLVIALQHATEYVQSLMKEDEFLDQWNLLNSEQDYFDEKSYKQIDCRFDIKVITNKTITIVTVIIYKDGVIETRDQNW